MSDILHHMKINSVILFALGLSGALLFSCPNEAFGKKKKKKPEVAAVVAPPANKDSVEYRKLIKDSETKKGLFITHFSKQNKLYWEIPDTAFDDAYLLSNRMAATSNTQDFVAGQMVGQPMLLSLSRNENNVFLHKVQTGSRAEAGEPIAASFDRNFQNPILKAFKIEARTDSSVVIDVTSFFGGNEKCISPIISNPASALLSRKSNIKATFVPDASSITGVKTFPDNIEIESCLSFSTTPLNEPYTVQMHRSFVRLPKEPMRRRLHDMRVGYFYSDCSVYTTEKDKIYTSEYIHRWRLEPKDEERERYFAGELVEPQKPIVFYVDSAFPEKWRVAVKQGIEDWNAAFEAAGFKNAVQARDYPADDPDFDPDDMRYSCVKYATTTIANAMGPSFVDPRSGEILTADVIWYHNIISLLHDWRFCQTAAVDARVRKPVFDDEVMQESMRYVASHEIGHTLGLMHNMGASYAFPVDSLRSPAFTQKYGTTPSIMDYARNNFVARPGDLERGVKLTPPILGVYDIYAIDWGYRLIPDAATPDDEKAVLTAWIEEKAGDPMYTFGAQQFMGTVDPTDQTEDLGNDHLRAGDYAVSNLEIIMQNLEQWAAEPGETYEPLGVVYEQLVKQYSRHIGHVMAYIGGIEYSDARQGTNALARTYINKKTQKQAMQWLLRQARTYDRWLTPPALMMKLDRNMDCNAGLRRSIVACLLNQTALYRIDESSMADNAENYTLEGYLDDAIAEIFKLSYQGKALDAQEQDLQAAALALMMSYSGLDKNEKNAAAAKQAFDAYREVQGIADCPDVPCSHTACGSHAGENGFVRYNLGQQGISRNRIAPLMTAQLRKIESLYKSRKAAAPDRQTREFYDYRLLQIEELFNR